MKKTAFVLIGCFLAISSYPQTPTLLGIHGVFSPNISTELGAQVLRYGFTDHNIESVFLSGGETTVINKMVTLNSLNIKQIVFLRWPKDTIEVVGTNYERIPVGDDRDEVFQYLDRFLMAVGPHIDWIQINQEPLGATKYHHNEYTISEIIQWWITVAQFIRDKQTAHPAELGHLKIMTGGITGIKGVIDSPDSPIAPIIDAIIQFGEDYCDAIDLHLHTPTLDRGAAEIEYITNRTNHPLACTEWSQSHAAVETGWLNDINTVWVDSSDPYFGLTNEEVLDTAYTTQMDTLDWDNFIATSPYTVNFIPDFYNILDGNCFLMACYAGVWQYGNPRFDWNQLMATKTVTVANYPNNPFYTEYINLTSALKSGSYNTNCSITAIKNKIENNFVKIYPNPVNDILYIETDGKLYNAKIFNTLGKQVAGFTINGSAKINLSYLHNGVYVIKVWGNEKERPVKFIKQ